MRPMVEKLSRETLRRVRAVEDALAHYSLDGDNLQAALEALRVLLETDKVLLYSLVQRRKSFERLIGGRRVTWGGYHAVRPDPVQRDRVLRSEEIAELTAGQSREVETVMHRQLGTVGVPAFRWRLEFERMVSEATIAQSALDALIERVKGAVWVLGPAAPR